MAVRGGSDDPTTVIDQMLGVVRTHLGMDVAFVSRFLEGNRVFQHVSSELDDPGVVVGRGDPLEQTLCLPIVEGRLEPLTADVTAVEAVADLPVIAELGIIAYAGVPITLPGQGLFGTLCAYGRDRREFVEDDLPGLRLAASLIAERLGQMDLGAASPSAAPPHITVLYQPITHLRTGEVVGYEALARFEDERVSSPHDWFALGRRMGVDIRLQHHTAALALSRLDQLPASTFLTVNLSEAALCDPEVLALITSQPPGRVIVEITEEMTLSDPALVRRTIAEVRSAGVRIALDDLGTGHSSLERVLTVQPDVIKVDASLVSGVNEDPSRQAMLASFVSYARAVDVQLIAEGIETRSDAEALRILGVHLGQGFHLGRPTTTPWAASDGAPETESV